MKKHISFTSFVLAAAIAAAANAADCWKIRGGIPNSQYFFKLDRAGNQYIFFIGDLAQCPKGLHPSLRYTRVMTDAVKKRFGGSPREVPQPMDGGTWFAQYRCAWGKPVFGERICSGHLAVVGLAGGDVGVDPDQAEMQLENLLRQIVRYRATHSRILVHTLAPGFLDDYLAGRTPEWIKRAERLADHYNIPSLDLAKVAADAIRSGKISKAEFSADGVVPSTAGAKIWSEAAGRFMDELLAAFPVPEKPARQSLPTPLNPKTHGNGRIIAYESHNVVKKGDWLMGQKSPVQPFRHVLVSKKAGDELTMEFNGVEIGIIDVIGPDAAACEWSVDDSPFKRLEPSPETSMLRAVAAEAGQDHAMRALSLARGLSPAKPHVFKLRTCGGGEFRLGGILLNGTVKPDYDGMNSLQRIDAIWSEMDPLDYTPPTGRFANIPRTMKTLREGGELRMVLLGDSIIGNTSGSQFELLLARRFPKAKIKKITSIRSSTGCKWYRHENRVQEWVLRHEPDLLVIGGISNGDAESVQDVVRQVRAKRPDQEILLLTPVFGSLTRDDWIKNFTYEIDDSRPNFRAGLRKVAAEEKCAFFDMTGPWWKYILSTGKTPGWFWGDAVHGNERGCQIIGRLLERWFVD